MGGAIAERRRCIAANSLGGASIDRRLAEWRDKEIANRLRILKITLWASVIVASLSLIYSYVKVNFYDKPAANATTMPAAKR